MKLSPEKTYLFFDFDGTLYCDGKVNEETLKSLRYAKEKGCKLYLNTGRTKGHILREYDILKSLDLDGFLCAGCAIYMGTGCEKTVYETVLPKEEIESLIRFSCDKSYWFTIETIESIHTCKIYGEIVYTKNELEVFYRDILETIKDENAVKISIFPPRGKTDDSIVRIFDKYDWVVYPHLYELYHKGQNKGSILDKFREVVGAKDSVFVAFGDSENDVDFFKHADIAVAMSHAPKILTDLADFKATTPNGVAEMIYKLI